MKYDLCKIVETEKGTMIKDYRLKNKMLSFTKGKLGDLKEWYYKSNGISDLLSNMNWNEFDLSELAIVEYRGRYGAMYAVGLKK